MPGGKGGLRKVKVGRPQNPVGRTGMTGRGLLGRWGPNKAVDPVVMRRKRNPDDSWAVGFDGKPIAEVVLVRRRDNGELAFPGGMVDPAR